MICSKGDQHWYDYFWINMGCCSSSTVSMQPSFRWNAIRRPWNLATPAFPRCCSPGLTACVGRKNGNTDQSKRRLCSKLFSNEQKTFSASQLLFLCPQSRIILWMKSFNACLFYSVFYAQVLDCSSTTFLQRSLISLLSFIFFPQVYFVRVIWDVNERPPPLWICLQFCRTSLISLVSSVFFFNCFSFCSLRYQNSNFSSGDRNQELHLKSSFA